ncbi:MAG: hypothetical protein ACK48P_00795 [Holosporales bacterium]
MKKFKSLNFKDLWSAKSFKGLGEEVINVKACLLLLSGFWFVAGFLVSAVIFTRPHRVLSDWTTPLPEVPEDQIQEKTKTREIK